MRSEITLAYCTFPNRAVAENVCHQLVSEGLIACANIFAPHTAVYAWGGQVHSDSEIAALLKLNSRKRKALEERIRAIHPYSVPAVVYLKVDGGLPEFVQWVYNQSL